MSASNTSSAPSLWATTPVTTPPRWVRLQARHLRVDEERDVGMLEGRQDGDRLCVCLGPDQAGITVTPGAADARTRMGLVLVEHDAAGCAEGVVSRLGQVLADLGDSRFVAHCRPPVLPAPRPFGRVFAVGPVHVVEPLGLCVPRLEVVVGERPLRRNAVGVLDLAEISRSQAVQRCPVELRRPAHEVVNLWLERFSIRVPPRVRRDVAALPEDRAGLPVLLLPRQEAPTFEQQHALAARGERVGECAAACPGTDDDHVVVVGHGMSSWSFSK